jgi:hypothetical protein
MMLIAGAASGDSTGRVPYEIFDSIQDSFTTHRPAGARPAPHPTLQPESVFRVNEVCGAQDALRPILQ